MPESALLDRVIGRHVAGSFLGILAVYTLSVAVGTPPFTLVEYLVVAGSDVVQNPLLPDLEEDLYWAYFTFYLYGLGVVFGNLGRWLARRFHGGRLPAGDAQSR